MNKIATALIRQYEKCVLKAYQDGGGVWTIGWGSTGPGIVEGLVWSQAMADQRQGMDQLKIESYLLALVRVPLTEGQWGPLICLAYNVGGSAVASSVLLKQLNAKAWCQAVREWLDFDHDGGHEVKGLLVRRLDECLTFLRATP